MALMGTPYQQVIEVVEYIDDDDWGGSGDEYEIVEILEEVVKHPCQFTPVQAYEVGIGAAPPASALYEAKYGHQRKQPLGHNGGTAVSDNLSRLPAVVRISYKQQQANSSHHQVHASSAEPDNLSHLPAVARNSYQQQGASVNGIPAVVRQSYQQASQAPADNSYQQQRISMNGVHAVVRQSLQQASENQIDAQNATSNNKTSSAGPCLWKSAVDPNSGKTYYYHSITRETQWDKPVELTRQEEQDAASLNQAAAPPQLASLRNSTTTSQVDELRLSQRESPNIPPTEFEIAPQPIATIRSSIKQKRYHYQQYADPAYAQQQPHYQEQQEFQQQQQQQQSTEFDEEEYSEYEEVVDEYEEEVIEEDEYEEYEEEELDGDYYEEIELEETPEEAEMRVRLEKEIAELEKQLAEAQLQHDNRAEGESETLGEKARRIAMTSQLESCKAQQKESDFKRRAAARAKYLAEKENEWVGKKGKGKKGRVKRSKSIEEVVLSKLRKQRKLLEKAPTKRKSDSKRKSEAKTEPAAVAPALPAVKEKKPLTMQEMLLQKQSRGMAGPDLPKKPTLPVHSPANDSYIFTNRDFLPSDDEEEDGDEEEEENEGKEEEAELDEFGHKKYTWEQPAWTKARLKTTTKGVKARKGKNLAGKITHIEKKINEGLDEDAEDNNTGAFLSGAVALPIKIPKRQKHHANLNYTVNGARIRDGRKIEAAIVVKDTGREQKTEMKIWGADPEDLKLTPRGNTLRKGKNLAEPVTFPKKEKHKFEHTIKSKKALTRTRSGEALEHGGNLAKPITKATETSKFEKPEWTKKKALKETEKGSKLKSGEDIAPPIVVLDQPKMNVNLEANPAFLKNTEIGDRVREGENLAGPITQAPHLKAYEFEKR